MPAIPPEFKGFTSDALITVATATAKHLNLPTDQSDWIDIVLCNHFAGCTVECLEETSLVLRYRIIEGVSEYECVIDKATGALAATQLD